MDLKQLRKAARAGKLVCEECRGTKQVPGPGGFVFIPCHKCCPPEIEFTHVETHEATCEKCNGQGYIMRFNRRTCEACCGTGMVTVIDDMPDALGRTFQGRRKEAFDDED